MDTRRSIDMLNGKLLSKIIFFALPIALSGMLQQLFNFADTAVVGKFADSNALAAVGTNTELVALIVTFSSGLAVGINVIAAGMIGRDHTEEMPKVIRAAALLVLMIGFLVALIGQAAAHPILELIHTPKNIMTDAVLYLRIYLLGYPFLLIFDFASAVLRSYGDSRRPLAAMAASGVINVFLNLFFVILCRFGVLGVALATDISTIFSAVLTVYWVYRDILRKERGTDKTDLSFVRRILGIGLPAAVQGAVFCFANIFMQSAVNGFGEDAVAGAAIALNFEYFTYYMITAFGQAAATFTGQNYSAGKLDRCRQITRICVTMSFLFCSVMTVPSVLFRTQVSGIFTTSAAVVHASSVRLRMLIFEPVCAVYESIAGSMRGRGRSLLPAVETILGICLLRIVWIEAVFPRFGTPEILYLAFPISWILTSGILAVSYLAVVRKFPA